MQKLLQLLFDCGFSLACARRFRQICHRGIDLLLGARNVSAINPPDRRLNKAVGAADAAREHRPTSSTRAA